MILLLNQINSKSHYIQTTKTKMGNVHLITLTSQVHYMQTKSSLQPQPPQSSSSSSSSTKFGIIKPTYQKQNLAKLNLLIKKKFCKLNLNGS